VIGTPGTPQPSRGNFAVILLDTNVISELMRPQPEPRVLAWADGLDPEAVAITAMNEAEILHGLARLPPGRRKQNLQQR
jgi:predicted nucleic acid-binding protein